MNKATEKILSVLGCDEFLVSLSFVDEKEIADLNKRYRGKEGSTDVLSFPQTSHNERQSIASFVKRKELLEAVAVLGDVVICPEVAAKNAKEDDKPFDDEVIFLVIHSILHLLGYDHQTHRDAKRMQLKENEVLAAISRPTE